MTSNCRNDCFRNVRGNEIFKYIFINRENRISLTNTKIGGDLEVTGTFTLPKINNTQIGYDTSGQAAFTDLSAVDFAGITSVVNTSTVRGDQSVGGALAVSGAATLGSARITGNLVVEGSTTTTSSSNMTVDVGPSPPNGNKTLM